MLQCYYSVHCTVLFSPNVISCCIKKKSFIEGNDLLFISK